MSSDAIEWHRILKFQRYSGHPGTVVGWAYTPHIHPSQTIPGSRDTLTIPGLYRDGHTAHTTPLVRVSQDSGILWQGWCVLIPVQSQDGQSISGSWYSLAAVDVWCVWSSHYCPGMARVSLELKNSMPFCGITGHPSLHGGLHETTQDYTWQILKLLKIWPLYILIAILWWEGPKGEEGAAKFP